MAVEARHNMNSLLFSSHQLVLPNRDFMKFSQETGSTPSHVNHDSAETLLLPMYHNHQWKNVIGGGGVDNVVANNHETRKRQRLESSANQENRNLCKSESGIAFQIQHQHCEIDRLVAEHAERVRAEMERQRKREARTVVRALEEGIEKRLREKEEEIVRMGKLNWVLQERVKSLSVENQLWKDLAQSNQATAMSLRTNLEQVLLAASDEESCCGSTEPAAKENEATTRMCRVCVEQEATVLLLPCRHLCLCSSCGSQSRACPLCSSPMTASVRVNFS